MAQSNHINSLSSNYQSTSFFTHNNTTIEYNNNGVKHSHYSIFTVLKKCRSLKKAINWGLENYQGIRYVRGLDGKEIDTYELKINGLL